LQDRANAAVEQKKEKEENKTMEREGLKAGDMEEGEQKKKEESKKIQRKLEKEKKVSA